MLRPVAHSEDVEGQILNEDPPPCCPPQGLLALPTEIISEILFHFLPIYPLCSPLTGLLSPTLSGLTHICPEFRAIALHTPALWRAITISYPRGIPLERQIQTLDLWLVRSRCCPLSIQIEVNRFIPKVLMEQVIAAVVSHRARLEYVHLIRLSAWRRLAADGPVPLLRHLHFLLDDDLDAVSIIPSREVPLLRSVILEDFAITKITLPWAQLTSLTLKDVWRYECLPILQQAPNLRQCQLAILFNYTVYTDPHEITLPCLELLVLDDPSDNWVNKTYPDVFVVPALRSLRIKESAFLAPNPITSLTTFISKAGCTPQEVCVTGERTVTGASYRQAFPSIPNFSFTGSCGIDGEDANNFEPSNVEADL